MPPLDVNFTYFSTKIHDANIVQYFAIVVCYSTDCYNRTYHCFKAEINHQTLCQVPSILLQLVYLCSKFPYFCVLFYTKDCSLDRELFVTQAICSVDSLKLKQADTYK